MWTSKLVGAEEGITRREFERLRKLREFDASGGALELGFASTLAWLRVTLRLTATEASRRLKLARALDHLPDTAKAGAQAKSPSPMPRTSPAASNA